MNHRLSVVSCLGNSSYQHLKRSPKPSTSNDFSSIKFGFWALKESTKITPYFSLSLIILSRIISTWRVTSEGLSPLCYLNRNCWIIYLPLCFCDSSFFPLLFFFSTFSSVSQCFHFSIFLYPGFYGVFIFINTFIKIVITKTMPSLCQHCPGHSKKGKVDTR